MNREDSRKLFYARAIYIADIVIILAFAAILYIILPALEDEPVFSPENTNIVIPVVMLSGFALVCLFIGLFAMRLKGVMNLRGAFAMYIFRAGVFEAAAVPGLMLGVLGLAGPVAAVFFIVPAGLMLYTFPTGARWREYEKKLAARQAGPPSGKRGEP